LGHRQQEHRRRQKSRCKKEEKLQYVETESQFQRREQGDASPHPINVFTVVVTKIHFRPLITKEVSNLMDIEN
jgi:hypothetical protein